MKIKSLFVAVIALAIIGVGILPILSYATGMRNIQRAELTKINAPSYTPDGNVMRPSNWRHWIYVGTPLTPNALNNGKAPFPEFHNVYAEPSAFEHYKRTGKWPDGTQLAKELVSVRNSPTNYKDGSSIAASGRGYFQGEFQGLELAVKDTKRFAKEPGGWAYFSFGHKKPPYAETAKAFPTDKCNACHQAAPAVVLRRGAAAALRGE